MLPTPFPSNLKCSRGKRSNFTSVFDPVYSAKRLALESGEDSLGLPHADGEAEGNRNLAEERGSSTPAFGTKACTSNCSCEGLPATKQEYLLNYSAAQDKPITGRPPQVHNGLVSRALQISGVRRLAKMEGARQSQRTPEEVELALEVLNDELAGASPLDRPSLELATQALTDRLVELRKQQRGSPNPPEAAGGAKQSTREYSSSLQAVILGDGKQKYTLIKIPKQDDMHSDIYLVRGDPKAEYHYQTALDTLNALQSRNILSDVTGGGRMDVLRAEKKVEIYGYSYQYGAADHSITAKMVKEYLGDEFIVSFGNYGY